MINFRFIYNFILALESTFWMISVYLIKSRTTILGCSSLRLGLISIAVPFILSGFVLKSLTSKLAGPRPEELKSCTEFRLIDKEFLQIYLGYFFVSLSIYDYMTFLIIYIIVFIFTLASQTQYFNPMFLLFGYHYYDISTDAGTHIIVIAKGEVIRNKKDINFHYLRRINDTTFIERKG